MAHWEKYGLATPGWFRVRKGEPRYERLPRSSRFRVALEEGGGLFPVFGRFLLGRADLLSSDYLYELRTIRSFPKLPSTSSLDSELASRLTGIEAVGATPGCDVFRAFYQNRPVVVEVYGRNSEWNAGQPSDGEWTRFCRIVRQLGGGPESSVSRPAVLEQFRQWLQLQADIERKRNFLTNLQAAPQTTLTRFPAIVAELQSPSCLAYEAIEGTPLDEAFDTESTIRIRSLETLTEAILEQALLLSVIDTDLRTENYLLTADGGLGFRTLPAWISVPVEWHYELLQYLASSVAGNTPRALQMLCRMSSSRDAYLGEQQLLSELSSLQPELKINAVTPESVTVIENFWRALANTAIQPPLFVHLMHRNLTILGQHNESVAPSKDAVAETLWPVLGRVLSFHLKDVLLTEKGREWIVSSGLFLMTAARQMALAFENLRENIGDMTEMLESKDAESRTAKLDRRTATVMRSAILLIVFLFSVQLALGPGGGPFPFLTKTVALAAAAGLCWSIAGIK